MGGETEIESEGLFDVENTIFVAVGKNVKESKTTLLWALQNSGGKKICLLHVHQPAQLVTLMDEKLSANKLKQQAVKACRELEQQNLHKLLNQYLLIVTQFGSQAGKVWIEMDSVEKGIAQIIAEHDIRWLVMGAAADKHYSKELTELKSKKAIFVRQQASVSCHIWFVCKGCLVYIRSTTANSNMRSIRGLPSPTSTRGTMFQQSCRDANEDADGPDEISRRLSSQSLINSIGSNDEMVDTLKSITLSMDELRGESSPIPSLHKSQYNLHHSLPEENFQDRGSSKKLEYAMLDAENSKQKAFEESVRRWRAEEDAMDAIHKAESSESLCLKETNQRKELEQVQVRQKQELEKMQNQHDQFTEELQMIQDQKPELETRIIESRRTEEELEEKIIQAAKLLVAFKEKRDRVKLERNNAVREVNGLRNLLEGVDSSLGGRKCFTFSFLEINEATRDFDPSWKIGDGRYGSVYKGYLRHLKVAIKMLPCCGSQGHLDFERELGLLSRVRHPNLVTLIGTCPESRSLIYEYLENGSLEDRLACQGKTPPLLWQSRMKIAIEICSALIFIHTNNPCIIHGNLKPTKVLLDPNFVSKLGDLGVYRLIHQSGKSDPEASVYIDPEFLETQELSTKSDVYSFGIVLLRLLTGRPALGIVKDVKCAVECGNFDTTVLDLSAGDWPVEQAKRLACLALRCCEKKRSDRPDLVLEVWTVIEPMRDLCTSSCMDSKGCRRTPSHFVCPIVQEVMEDPQIAADGFTYEADAIRGWLNSGHETSPMTNLKLDHCDLLPNYALYYAIQEWQQQS